MSAAPRYRKSDAAALRRIADEAFLVPVCGTPADMQKVFVLNSLAEFIWRRLDGATDLDDLLAAIVERFDVDRERAAMDAAAFLDQLRDQGLIQEVS
ncbi:MAG: PqqD family protein [Candidatus Aminicenantes bacterium]|nr:PqqD family protein [Candidatus Aminicenantes bacterium]